MKISAVFKDGSQVITKPGGSFTNPEQTLLELYQNYKSNKEFTVTDAITGESSKRSYKDLKTLTIDFNL